MDIQSHEKAKIFSLFFQNFFEGLGSAFLYTIGISMFNTMNQVFEFTFVFIAAGLIIIAIGPVYERIEHATRPDKLLYGLGGFILVLILIAIYFVSFSTWDYRAVAILTIHSLIYFFKNTQFWGLSALIFDVRESKRIFSIVGSGDLPAKFLGYSVVVSLTSKSSPYLNEFLIAGSILAYLASFYFLRSVIRMESDILTQPLHDHRGKGKNVEITRLFENKLIRAIGGMAMFATFVFFLLEFSFVKDIMHDLEHGAGHGADLGHSAGHGAGHVAEHGTVNESAGIAQVLATLLGITYGVATILKLFVSAKFLQKLNLRVLLYSFPIAIILVGGISYFLNPTVFPDKPLYLVFIVLYMVSVVIKDAFYKPLSLSLFQPLAREKRLHGHNVIKALAEPAGMVGVGLVLLLLYRKSHYETLDFNIITMVLGIAIVPWALTSERLVRVYREALTKLINRKLFSNDRFLLIDSSMEGSLKSKLSSDNGSEVLYALRLLKASNTDLSEELPGLMNHSDSAIRFAARDLFLNSDSISDVRKIDFLHRNVASPDRELQLFCLEELGKRTDWDYVEERLHIQDHDALYALIRGWAKNAETGNEETIRERIREMVRSEDVSSVLHGIHLMKLYPSDEFRSKLIEFFSDTDDEVVSQAIDASVTMPEGELLETLIGMLKDPKWSRTVQSVLRRTDESVLQVVRSKITDHRSRLNFRLISVVGNHHSEQSKSILLDLLTLQNPDLRDFVLGYCQMRNVVLEDASVAKGLLQIETDLLDLVEYSGNGTFSTVLNNEQRGAMHRIFRVCALIADGEALSRAEAAFFSNNKDLKANAIETLSVVLPASVFSHLRKYLELYPSRKMESEKLAKPILERHHMFYDWTVASAMSRLDPFPSSLMSSLKTRESDIIQEQLQVINNEIMSSSSNLQLLEKVLILKQTPLFSETPENILLDIAEISDNVEYSGGEVIFNKGDEGDCLYIIYSGQCEVYDDKHLLATLGEKDFFGDLALLDPEPRSATVKTKYKSVLLKIDQHAIYELMSDRIEVAQGIIKVLCRRLRNQNVKFAEVKSQLENQ